MLIQITSLKLFWQEYKETMRKRRIKWKWVKKKIISKLHRGIYSYLSWWRSWVQQELLRVAETQTWSQASQPLRTVAFATRLTARVKAPIRRSQSWVLHMSFTSLKPLVMYVFSSLFTFSSSHMNPCMFCVLRNHHLMK